MGKGDGKLELIAQQNELLRQQNELLREQNELLRQPEIRDEREVFIKDVDRDEMRNGFLVTSHRKKLWNVQIGLINEFARICKKHDLRWFAFYGTLLGAARHKGFVPWDDDVDIVMLRPDYEKFKSVMTEEIKEPYFVDACFNYKLEEEQDFSETNLQLVKSEQRKKLPIYWPFWPMIKIRDKRTSMIQWPEREHVNQGIWIDIFPFDPVPPFSGKQHKINYEIEREMLFAIALPDILKNALKKNEPLLIKREILEKFLSLPHKQKILNLDSFALKNFLPSEYVGQLRGHCLANLPFRYALKNFEETVYLPFETIELPAPKGYEDCLTSVYGNWHEMVKYSAHILDYSVDISSEEYFKAALQNEPQK